MNGLSQNACLKGEKREEEEGDYLNLKLKRNGVHSQKGVVLLHLPPPPTPAHSPSNEWTLTTCRRLHPFSPTKTKIPQVLSNNTHPKKLVTNLTFISHSNQIPSHHTSFQPLRKGREDSRRSDESGRSPSFRISTTRNPDQIREHSQWSIWDRRGRCMERPLERTPTRSYRKHFRSTMNHVPLHYNLTSTLLSTNNHFMNLTAPSYTSLHSFSPPRSY